MIFHSNERTAIIEPLLRSPSTPERRTRAIITVVNIRIGFPIEAILHYTRAHYLKSYSG